MVLSVVVLHYRKAEKYHTTADHKISETLLLQAMLKNPAVL